MRTFTSIPAALAAVGLLACVGSAHALATATATLSNFQVQLFDLTPLDGIAPSVTFDGGANVYTTAADPTFVSNYDSNLAGTALTVSSAVGNALSTASTAAGNFFMLGAGPGASASASAFGGGTQASGSAYLLSSTFTLSANTLMVFSANSGTTAARTLAGEAAEATAFIQMSSDDNSQSSYGQSYIYVGDNSNYSNLQPLIQASFVNLTAASVTGYASAYANAFAAGVTAVPEPETYAMMLVGVLVVGSLARRRNTRSV